MVLQESYEDVLHVGKNQSDTRTPQQTTIGLWWAYDGAFKIGTPIRLFTQVCILS